MRKAPLLLSSFLVLGLASCNLQIASSSSDNSSSLNSSSSASAPASSEIVSSGEEESSASSPISFLNPSFEQGIEGWHDEGIGAFDSSCIVNSSSINDVPSLKEGDYFFSGGETLGSFTGTLESDYFTLTGLGLLSFRMGAGKSQDKIYIEFYKEGSDEPLSFYVNGGKEAISKVGNMDFNGSTITDQMIIKYVDLSDYLDENIKIKVTDNDTSSVSSDYSYVNLDAFSIIQNGAERAEVIAERESELTAYKDDFEESDSTTSLRNGGFETGDLSGWKVLSGDAFDDASIDSARRTYWSEGREYHAKGDYFLNGELNGESKIGSIRSEKFTQNEGYISFYMGAAKYGTTYVCIYDVSKDVAIKNISNEHFNDGSFDCNLYLNVVDVSEYKGDVMYIMIIDSRDAGDFGFITADEFVINESEEDIETLIAKEKADAALYKQKDSANYLDLYNNKESFPIAGEAPLIEENEGYAYNGTLTPKASFDPLAFIKANVSSSDDYTANNALTYSLGKATKDGEEITDEPYSLSEGVYEFSFSVSDAYNQASESKIKLTVAPSTNDKDVVNGGFESGSAEGWTLIEGEPDLKAAISSDSTYWDEQIPFNKSGSYFWNGWNALSDENETKGYSLKSSTFLLSGSGYISLALGGNSAYAALYKDDGTEVGLYHNDAFSSATGFPYVGKGSRCATLTHYLIDASQYLGEDLYIVLMDKEGYKDEWGVAFFDDVVTYYEEAPSTETMVDTFVDAKTSGDKYDATYDGKETSIAWLEATNIL